MSSVAREMNSQDSNQVTLRNFAWLKKLESETLSRALSLFTKNHSPLIKKKYMKKTANLFNSSDVKTG